MKDIIKLFLIALSGSFIAITVIAQEQVKKVKTSEFSVSGVCEMCEKRIENAALIKGVKYADWSRKTHILKVIYKTKLTNEKAIQDAIAEAGHDTDKVKATDENYQKLPKCCAYRDGVRGH